MCIQTREEAQARTKSAPSAPSSAPRNDRDAARAAAAARSRTAGYSRYDQEQFTQGLLIFSVRFASLLLTLH